jgi:hypothetical protein
VKGTVAPLSRKLIGSKDADLKRSRSGKVEDIRFNYQNKNKKEKIERLLLSIRRCLALFWVKLALAALLPV